MCKHTFTHVHPYVYQYIYMYIYMHVCTYGTTLSDLQGQEEGVPQGSILSVTLFSVKINNIVKALNPGVVHYMLTTF